CALAERLRQLRERAQLTLALDVEAVDAGVERGRQLGYRFPYPAEDDLLGGDAGQPGAVQLARADDVRARAQAAQQPEHREVAVRLDGVGDQAVERRKGLVERAVAFRDLGRAVDVERRAVLDDELLDRDVVAVEVSVPVAERAGHCGLSMHAPTPPRAAPRRRTPGRTAAPRPSGTPRRAARGSSPSFPP